jgi:hypothetical protein
VPILWTKVELFCEIFLFAKSQRQYIKITKSLCDHTSLNKKTLHIILGVIFLHPLSLEHGEQRVIPHLELWTTLEREKLLTRQPGRNFTSKLLERSRCGATHVPIPAIVADNITLPCQKAFIKIRDMYWRTRGGPGGLRSTPQNLRIFSSANFRLVLWEDEANLRIVLSRLSLSLWLYLTATCELSL